MRARTVHAAVLALAASALAGLLAAQVAAPSDGTVARAVGSALVSADGRQVSVTETGPCLGAGELTAHESDTSVTLELRVVPHAGSGPCLGGAQLLVRSVALSAPLRGRRLVDRASGLAVPFFRGADLLHAGPLPSGFRFAYVAPGYALGGSTEQWDPAASTLYLGGPVGAASGAGVDGAAAVWLVEEYGGHWPDGWPNDAPLVSAHGRLARVGPDGLAWRDRTADGSVLSVALLADPPLPTAVLTTMADGLRPDADGPPGGNPSLTTPPPATGVE
ncbi:hypothetical protein [Streptacidiphilus jiangxiensis]|uniref:Uncharacterized protein n=1 Tax=Streptacidiphilus jiangxiensis TaxID=235985 RepID=A0A1H7TN24_STRJI|nr:hypothetical protein [Streptacidiphilus jiangxiensis]SEL85869.1 hypothetical protein SAMN05414137_11479 [Streptacidiphilus jiangxiensis]